MPGAGPRQNRVTPLGDVVAVPLRGAWTGNRGRLHEGAGGTAGEIGHTPTQHGTAICRCGSRGCLETVASARAIAEQLSDEVSKQMMLRVARDYEILAKRAAEGLLRSQKNSN